MITIRSNIADIFLQDVSHVSQHRENDESRNETGQAINGTREDGISEGQKSEKWDHCSDRWEARIFMPNWKENDSEKLAIMIKTYL